MSRLLKALHLEIDEPLTIECDNRQTIRLLIEQAARLQTKLRHVDIHSHWLRQGVQKGAIHIKWQETKQMMADGLTKDLGKQPFNHFIDLIGMENLQERLEAIRKEDDLSEQSDTISTIAFVAHSETWDAREIRLAVYDRH
jgi:antitoxin component of MazEF toxin-antitoxin module